MQAAQLEFCSEHCVGSLHGLRKFLSLSPFQATGYTPRDRASDFGIVPQAGLPRIVQSSGYCTDLFDESLASDIQVALQLSREGMGLPVLVQS